MLIKSTLLQNDENEGITNLNMLLYQQLEIVSLSIYNQQ